MDPWEINHNEISNCCHYGDGNPDSEVSRKCWRYYMAAAKNVKAR
jgi:hypothetical protein